MLAYLHEQNPLAAGMLLCLARTQLGKRMLTGSEAFTVMIFAGPESLMSRLRISNQAAALVSPD